MTPPISRTAALRLPRPVAGIAQIPAAVQYRDHKQVIGGGLVNDPVSLKNNFPDFFAIYFGHAPTQTRDTSKPFHSRKQAPDELPGIKRRILADLGVQLLDVVTCVS
jgi:hypothetical protein